MLDDIRYNIEIQNRATWLDLGDVEGIDGVPMAEHRKIIITLLKSNFLIEKPTYGQGSCCIDVDIPKFVDFTNRVVGQINKLRGAQSVPDAPLSKGLRFDKDRSLLIINGYEVKISTRDQKTVAHDILEYIFIDHEKNLGDEFFYSEIAFDKFGDEKYTSNQTAWRKYHAACMDIQDKIRKASTDQIKDFLIYNASQKGRVKINEKYLE